MWVGMNMIRITLNSMLLIVFYQVLNITQRKKCSNVLLGIREFNDDIMVSVQLIFDDP